MISVKCAFLVDRFSESGKAVMLRLNSPDKLNVEHDLCRWIPVSICPDLGEGETGYLKANLFANKRKDFNLDLFITDWKDADGEDLEVEKKQPKKTTKAKTKRKAPLKSKAKKASQNDDNDLELDDDIPF